MKKNRKKAFSGPHLKPLFSIAYISATGITNLPPESITIQKVGKKAFGLSCLPKPWTLPFLVVSDKLMSQWLERKFNNQEKILNYWADRILIAAKSAGIDKYDQVIVRSSGQDEGIHERGKFYSKKGPLSEIKSPLNYCLEQLSIDENLKDCKIPLIVQKCVVPISAMGHLSNERRCYKELRDWLDEAATRRKKIPNQCMLP